MDSLFSVFQFLFCCYQSCARALPGEKALAGFWVDRRAGDAGRGKPNVDRWWADPASHFLTPLACGAVREGLRREKVRAPRSTNNKRIHGRLYSTLIQRQLARPAPFIR